jgi:MATE family multidrug resistance protein
MSPFQRETLWNRPSGIREVLVIALPMVASTLSWTLMSFIDSAILYRVSPAAMSAAFTASIVWFAALSFFWGLCSYASTFVSQYYGDGQPERIGPAVWQGVWLALIFTPIAIGAIPFAPSLFAMHSAEVAELEAQFFQVLCWGAPGMLAAQSLETFFSGRGRTWVVMCVDAIAVLINLVLAFVLVLGWGGIEPWGLKGAALATVTAQWSRAIMYAALMLQPAHQRDFHTLSFRLDPKLFTRLLRFGGPSGVQMMLDVSGFAVFVQFVGKLGAVPAEATSMVFRVSHLAFMPVWGLGMATAVLVGQRLGEDRSDLATRAAHTTLALALAYMGFISLVFVATPGVVLQGFAASESGAVATDHVAIRALAVQLMWFVAAYNIFDATIIIFASVLRGAGDTRFIMKLSIVSAIALMSATWYAVDVAKVGVYGCWAIIAVWIWLLAVAYFLRYRQGKWRAMRVIDQTHHHGVGGGAGEKSRLKEASAIDDLSDDEFAAAASGSGAT